MTELTTLWPRMFWLYDCAGRIAQTEILYYEGVFNFFETHFSNDFIVVLPEIYLTLIILMLLIYGVCYSSSINYKFPILIKNISYLSILTLFFTLILHINTPIIEQTIFNDLLFFNYATYFLKAIFLLGSITTIYLFFTYTKIEKLNAYEFIIITLLAILGLSLMINSNSLLAVYLALELQSLSLYILAAFKRSSQFSTEAGLKYFILGAISSGLILFGSALIYGFTGITNFNDLWCFFLGATETFTTASDKWLLITSNGAIIGFIFFLTGFLFKLTVAPFHMWAPDVYEGAPTIVTAFFAIVPKIAILALFMRLLFSSFYDLIEHWQSIMIICSIISMTLATFAAIYQKKIKRLLAYSSIGHMGYLLMGISTGTYEGLQASILYIIIYMIMTLNIFALVLSLRKQKSQKLIKYISDFSNLSQVNPLLAITFVISLFSLAGIPPLAGFCSKFYIFASTINSSLYLLSIIGVLTSVIGAFYYIRLIKIMYFEKVKPWVIYENIQREESLILAISFFFIVFFFAYPTPFLTLSHHIALNLTI